MERQSLSPRGPPADALPLRTPLQDSEWLDTQPPNKRDQSPSAVMAWLGSIIPFLGRSTKAPAHRCYSDPACSSQAALWMQN